MCRIHGPYKLRNKWQLKVVDLDDSKRSSNHYFPTEEEAVQAIPKLRRQYRRPVGIPVHEALRAYRDHGLHVRENKPRSVAVTIERLTGLLGNLDCVTGEVTEKHAAALWLAWSTRQTHLGRPPATNTKAGVLAETKTFWRWLVQKEWAKENPFDDLKVEGKRKKGKKKFIGVDQSKKFVDKALELARAGDVKALAALTAFILGFRASEVTDRIVSELDAGGTMLVISTDAKTEAGYRRVRIPEMLQPLLGQLAVSKEPEQKLFENMNRRKLIYAVRRICVAAGVPIISTHGLRGTHADLALDAGMSGPVVAKALGHESFAITRAHYANPESGEGPRVDRFLEALN